MRLHAPGDWAFRSVAGDHDAPRLARAAVAREEGELLPGKEVEPPGGLQGVQAHAFRPDAQIRRHGSSDALCDHANHALHILLRTNKVGRTRTVERELFQQRRIHVGTEAEGEDTPRATQLGSTRSEYIAAPLTDRRRAVRQEEHQAEAPGNHARFESALQCAGDVRASGRTEITQPALGGAALGWRHRRPVVAELPYLAREGDQPEAIVRAERVEQLPPSGARLFDLAAAHGARDVEHERDVARHRRAAPDRRGQCDERVPFVAVRRVREHAERCGASRTHGHEQCHRAGRVIHADSPTSTLSRGHRAVRRRPSVTELLRLRPAEGQRGTAGHGAVAAGCGDVHAQCLALALRDRPKAHDHRARLAGLDRKDPRAQHAELHPLDERGIALPADNLFIDAACLTGAERLAGDHLAIDLQREILECGTTREGQHVVGLADPRTVVGPALGHLVAQHAAVEHDAHFARRADDLLALTAGRRRARRGSAHDRVTRDRTARDVLRGEWRLKRNDKEEKRGTAKKSANHRCLQSGSPRRRRALQNLHTGA